VTLDRYTKCHDVAGRDGNKRTQWGGKFRSAGGKNGCDTAVGHDGRGAHPMAEEPASEKKSREKRRKGISVENERSKRHRSDAERQRTGSSAWKKTTSEVKGLGKEGTDRRRQGGTGRK